MLLSAGLLSSPLSPSLSCAWANRPHRGYRACGCYRTYRAYGAQPTWAYWSYRSKWPYRTNRSPGDSRS